jgi:hypothetical protein
MVDACLRSCKVIEDGVIKDQRPANILVARKGFQMKDEKGYRLKFTAERTG